MQSGNIAVVTLVALLGLLLLAALGGGMIGPGMMGWSGWGGSGSGLGAWSGIGMMAFWVVLLVGLVGLIVWLFRGGFPAAAGPTGPASRAEEILKERFARGELTREQYEQMRRDLRED